MKLKHLKNGGVAYLTCLKEFSYQMILFYQTYARLEKKNIDQTLLKKSIEFSNLDNFIDSLIDKETLKLVRMV